jgi:hypothetical protein
MDNAQKAIMIGVGLFITIIIISAVLLIVNLGTGLMNDATSELGSVSATLRGQLLDNWDGKTKTGTEVLAFLRQYHNSSSVCIRVKTNADVVYSGAAKCEPAAADGPDTATNYLAGGFANCTVTETGWTKTTYADFISDGIIAASKYYNTAIMYDSYGNVRGVAIIIA